MPRLKKTVGAEQGYRVDETALEITEAVTDSAVEIQAETERTESVEQPKRKRGRPRKIRPEGMEEQPKRKRGRPRKTPVEPESPTGVVADVEMPNALAEQSSVPDVSDPEPTAVAGMEVEMLNLIPESSPVPDVTGSDVNVSAEMESDAETPNLTAESSRVPEVAEPESDVSAKTGTDVETPDLLAEPSPVSDISEPDAEASSEPVKQQSDEPQVSESVTEGTDSEADIKTEDEPEPKPEAEPVSTEQLAETPEDISAPQLEAEPVSTEQAEEVSEAPAAEEVDNVQADSAAGEEEFSLKYDTSSEERYVDSTSLKTQFDKVLEELGKISKDMLSWEVDKFTDKFTKKFQDDSMTEEEANAKKFEAFLGGFITNAAMELYDRGYREAAFNRLEQTINVLEARRKLDNEVESIKARNDEDVVDLSDMLGLFVGDA